MSRFAYVGGFGNGHSSAEKVGNTLSGYFEDGDVFTFSEYVKNPDKIRRATKKAQLVTHSAGALAIAAGFNPDFVYLLNPPLPLSVAGLVGRTLVKTAQMNTPGHGIHNLSDVSSVLNYSASSIAELTAHPMANLGSLRKIAKFDAIRAASEAKIDGIWSKIVWTTNDVYFQPTQDDLDQASMNSIPITMLAGEHDEVVLRPEAFLAQVLNG